MNIGVFDSGVGGLAIAQAVEKAFPEHDVLLRQDRAHMPYGTKPAEEILDYVVPILEGLVADGCNVIVIACNTVSTTLVGPLRAKFPDIQLLAVEPMIKPAAAHTKTDTIAVCATPATLASTRYTQLKQKYAADLTVLEPDCSDWALMIEHKQIDETRIARRISAVLDAGADVIVLGCTHYHWIENVVKRLADGKAAVIQPEAAIIRRLRSILEHL